MINDNFRMYGLVNYQLGGTIHAGIQFGHAVQEYNNLFLPLESDNFSLEKGPSSTEIDHFNEWRSHCKTFIILNGGTTNKVKSRFGAINRHARTLEQMGILTAEFYEPDLGDQLTAVVFLVPEPVYNKVEYPDFLDWVKTKHSANDYAEYLRLAANYTTVDLTFDTKYYPDWVEFMGGPLNIELRKFLNNFRLA